jgi:NAD(P)-dependent dehydrogenase (short-subunit alcohol dehydrogenase family)
MKVALITGASQGLGAAAAHRLASDDYRQFLLVDRNCNGLAQVSDELAHLGMEVGVLEADLRDEETPGRAVTAAVSSFGRIDLLLNAAGSTERCGIDDTSPEAFARIFDVNVKAPLFMMQWAAIEMKKRQAGVIVNISSMLAYGGPPNLTTYSASKAALNVLTKSGANTWKRHGIRVFGINLGWTLTEGEHATQTTFHKMPENWAELVGARMPFGRLPTARDVAEVIAFLASPAAAMMTGAIIDHEQMPVGVFDQHPALLPDFPR